MTACLSSRYGQSARATPYLIDLRQDSKTDSSACVRGSQPEAILESNVTGACSDGFQGGDVASKTLDSIASQLPEEAVASIRAEIRALEAGPPETSSAPEIAAGQQVPAARVGTSSLGRAGAVTWETQEHVAVDAATAEHAKGEGHGALGVKESLRCWEGVVCVRLCVCLSCRNTSPYRRTRPPHLQRAMCNVRAYVISAAWHNISHPHSHPDPK